MSWLTVEINGELQGLASTDYNGDPATDPSVYADVLESVTVENSAPGDLRCSQCYGGFDTEEDAEGMECAEADVCDDPDCPCDWSTDHGPAHKLVPASLAWFNNAAITVDEDRDAVKVIISADDPRGGFSLEIRRVPDDAKYNAGQLIMYLPYANMSSPHMSLTQLTDGAFILGS